MHIGGHLAPDYAPQDVGTAAFAGSVDAPNTTMFNVRPNAAGFEGLKMPPPQNPQIPAFQPTSAGVSAQEYAPYGIAPMGSAMPHAQMPSAQYSADANNAPKWQHVPAGYMPNVGPVHVDRPIQSHAHQVGEGARSAHPNDVPKMHISDAQPAVNAYAHPFEQPAPAFNMPHAAPRSGNLPGYAPEAANSARPNVNVPMKDAQPASNRHESPPSRFFSGANARRRRDYHVDWDWDHPAWDYDGPYLFPFDLLGMINQLKYRVCVLEANAQLRNMGEHFNEGGEWYPNDGPSQQHGRVPVVQYQPWMNQQVMVGRSILQDPELNQSERTPLAGVADNQRRCAGSGAIGWAMLGFGGLAVSFIGWLLYAVLGMRADMRGLCEAMEQVEIGGMWEG